MLGWEAVRFMGWRYWRASHWAGMGMESDCIDTNGCIHHASVGTLNST